MLRNPFIRDKITENITISDRKSVYESSPKHFIPIYTNALTS